MADTVDVAVGVLVETRDDLPHVLVAKRPDDTVLPGFWELPGGKLEPGESARQCLIREFGEELGITVGVGDALPVVEHTYDHGRVRLHAFFCTRIAGRPRNLHVTDHRWVSAHELTQVAFPPANSPLIDAVCAVLSA